MNNNKLEIEMTRHNKWNGGEYAEITTLTDYLITFDKDKIDKEIFMCLLCSTQLSSGLSTWNFTEKTGFSISNKIDGSHNQYIDIQINVSSTDTSSITMVIKIVTKHSNQSCALANLMTSNRENLYFINWKVDKVFVIFQNELFTSHYSCLHLMKFLCLSSQIERIEQNGTIIWIKERSLNWICLVLKLIPAKL